MIAEKKVRKAIEIAEQYAGIDGGHHKQWVIDQMLRVLLEHDYSKWVKEWQDGEDGPETYIWDEGIAP